MLNSYFVLGLWLLDITIFGDVLIIVVIVEEIVCAGWFNYPLRDKRTSPTISN